MPLRLFPVAGGARFTDDWAEARSGGRTHAGNDLFGAIGAPLLAVDDGVVRFGTDPLGGNVANLYAVDGTKYYYAHMSGFAGSAPRNVRVGEVIGYLGDSGNARGTPSHLHFEVHPGNGAAVDPFQLLTAAPRAAAGSGALGGKSLVVPVLVALAVGLGSWAWMQPAQARRWVRRFV